MTALLAFLLSVVTVTATMATTITMVTCIELHVHSAVGSFEDILTKGVLVGLPQSCCLKILDSLNIDIQDFSAIV